VIQVAEMRLTRRAAQRAHWPSCASEQRRGGSCRSAAWAPKRRRWRFGRAS